MGVDAMIIGAQMRKVMVFAIKACYRSVFNHPFLAGFACFLMLLYRSSPFVFSFLVSASPVLICTAVSLGTLLSFGQTNIPEIEKEEEVTTHDVASLRIGVLEDTTVVKGDEIESFETVKRYVGKGRDIVENDLDPILVESRGIEVHEDGGLVDYMQLIDVNSKENLFEKQLAEKVERESDYLLELEKHDEVHEGKTRIERKLIDGEILDGLDSKDQIQNLVVEDEKSPRELMDTVMEDQLGSVPVLPFSDALRKDLLGFAPGSPFIDAFKEDQLGYTPGSSLIDALKEDHFASAPVSSLIMEDQLDSAPACSWRRIEEDYSEVAGADSDESLDSGSDGAESSSPDASMADIVPLLDELHPLLELEAPQPGCTSHDGSDSGSERLHESDDESIDSEEYMDDQGGEGESEDDDEDEDGEEGEGGDDNDDDDDEKEGETAKGEKGDESKSAIKWTEIDQKNLLDLGTSELERNRRLENLIARRRARKTMRLMADKNLIDFESYDLPFSFPPIATTRQNPFEFPDYAYDDMAIPGSAPSILLPSRNPFDLPYDSNEEKPNLQGDSFQQEFSVFQQKERVYRRNETIGIGPSIFGGSRNERQDFKWKPYSVPERYSSEEGTSYPSFQEPLSEHNESKLSSVPNSELVNSAVEEDRKSHEQLPEQLSSEGMSYATLQRQISESSGSKASSVPDTESVSSAVNEEVKKLNKQDVSQETQLISNADHSANHVECGGKSSGEVDSVDIEQADGGVLLDEVIALGDAENRHEYKQSSSRAEGTYSPQELKASESHLKTEPNEEYSSRSCQSSLSDVDENTPNVRNEDDSTNLEQKADVIEESGVSTHILPEESVFQFMSEVVNHGDPVYDSSNPGMERFPSFTSISSDTQLEIPEMTSLPVLLESLEKESEEHSEDTEKDSSEFEEMCASASQVNAVDENVSILREVTDTEASDLSVMEVRSSGVNPNFDDEKESVVSLFSSDIGLSEEFTVYRGEHFLPEKNQVVSSSLDSEILVCVTQNPDEKLDSVAPSCQITYADSSSSPLEGQVPSKVVEGVLVQPSVSSSETETLEERAKDQVDLVLLEQDDVNLSSSSDQQLVDEGMADKDRHMQHDANQAHSSNFDADNCDDGSLYVCLEQDPPSETEQSSMVHLIQELSSVNRETCQREVRSDSLEKNDSGHSHYQDTDGKVVSSNFGYKDIPFEEKSSSELENQLSCSDKSPSYDDPEEPQEATTSMIESVKEVHVANNESSCEDNNHGEKILENSSPLRVDSTSTPSESPLLGSPGGEEVNMVNNGNAFEIHDDELKTQRTSSSLTSDSRSTMPFESSEDQSPGGEDVKENILDRVVYGDPRHVSEHFYNYAEAYDPLVSDENINEETDEIKEFDEGLLSELDTVGDFSVNEVVSKSLLIEPTPTLTETNISSTVSLTNDSTPLETNLELPVLEVKSIHDIVLAFNQPDEGADVEEVVLPTMIENQVVPKDYNSDNLTVVEARSVEDINAVLEQLSQNDLAEIPKPLESNDHLAEVGKREVVSTEQIETSGDVHAGVQEDGATAADELKHGSEKTSETSSSRISNDKENIVNEVLASIRTEAPVVQTENENPKGTSV